MVRRLEGYASGSESPTVRRHRGTVRPPAANVRPLISGHARQRIYELSRCSPEEIGRIVDEKSVPVAPTKVGRIRRLIWSPIDEEYFLAVTAADGALVTLMPAEYKARVTAGDAFDMALKLHTDPPPRPPPGVSRTPVRLFVRVGPKCQSHRLGDYTAPAAPSALISDPEFIAHVRFKIEAHGIGRLVDTHGGILFIGSSKNPDYVCDVRTII